MHLAWSISDHSPASGDRTERRPGSRVAGVVAIMALSGGSIEGDGVDWHRLGDGDSEAGRRAGVLDLLRRAQAELGGEPLTGTRLLYDARHMLAATRQIEAAVRAAATALLVGFETSDPDRFGRVEVTDPSRSFTAFVSGDRRLVRAIAEHLEAIGRGS